MDQQQEHVKLMEIGMGAPQFVQVSDCSLHGESAILCFGEMCWPVGRYDGMHLILRGFGILAS